MHLSEPQLRDWLTALKSGRTQADDLFGFADVEMALISVIGDLRDAGRARTASLPSASGDSVESMLDEMEDLDRWIEAGLGAPLKQSQDVFQALDFSPLSVSDDEIDLGIRAWVLGLEARLQAGQNSFILESVLLDLFDAVAAEARETS